MPDPVTGFALVAIVLTIAGLASGFVDRAPLSFPIIFLGLGFLLGHHGLGNTGHRRREYAAGGRGDYHLSDGPLPGGRAHREHRHGRRGFRADTFSGAGDRDHRIAVVAIGSAYFLLDVSVIGALLLGTILASTDPVVLRDVVREERIPSSVRQALNIEAGTNDIVVLPTLLILIALANAEASGVAGWAMLVGQVLLLGPVVGFGIGAGAAWLMSKADERFGISEVYQSLYGVGIVLLSYSVATALGGDGFLAAFATGFAVAVLNFDLCQCFLDYGETTSEMAMLLAFILLGVVISDLFGEVPLVPALILAAIVIFIARPLAIGIVLRRAAVSNKARAFIGWFGPRGLNSLLLALLVLQAGVAGSEALLAVVGVVVTVSVIAHGVIRNAALSQAYGRSVENETHEEERDNAGGIFEGDASGSSPHQTRTPGRDARGRRAAGSPRRPYPLSVRAR